MTTEFVLNHHLTSFSEGNIEELLKDYTSESVLVGPTATLRGPEQIRALFAEWFETLFRPGTYEFTMDRLEIVGDVAYIAWHSENDGAIVSLGTDTLVIRDGKIACQTFAARIEPK